MSEWKEYHLGDIATIVDCEHKTAPIIHCGDFISVRTANISNGKIDFEKCNRVSAETFDSWTKRKMPTEGDIVLAREAPVGEVGWIPANRKVCLGQRTVLIKVHENGINSRYLLYYLVNNDTKYDLISRSTGSVVEHLNVKDIKQFEIKVHSSFNEQTAIAEVLSSLDDKMDLLQRQNKTLEQLAETLFRQWFVEKAEDSWEERGLDQIAEFMNGLACQKYPKKINEIGLSVIKIKELRTGITDASDIVTNDVPEKYLVSDGDMIFSWSGSLDVILWSGGKGVLNQHLFKVTSTEFPQWFYYLWVKHHLHEFRGIAEDKSTTMGHIQRHHLSDAIVLVPPKNKIKEMDEGINPLFQKIKSNTIQIRILTQLRDTLLPKLMNGEVRVKTS